MSPPPIEVRPLLGHPDVAYASHVVADEVLSPAECDAVVGLGSSLELEEADLEDDGAGADPATRLARVGWLGYEPDTAWLYERIADLAVHANERYGFDLVGFTEDLQYTVYDRPGSFYTWHQDGLDGPVAGRKLSIVIQLSPDDAYEDADLQFLDVVEDSTPAELRRWTARVRRQGTALVFPAFEYHRVTALRSGARRSLVCWIGGPPFR